MKKYYFIFIILIVLIICIIVNYNERVETNAFTSTPKQTIVVDDSLFSKFTLNAEDLLNTLSIDEKISQLLLVRNNKYLLNDIINNPSYTFGGIVFFESDFKNKTKIEVQEMINNLQINSKIPLLTAIDEEGGKISRISNNKNLTSTPFKSSQELYLEGGFNAIREDVINKSNILYNLGLNLNLAPVIDVAQSEDDYIYERTISLDTNITSIYAKTVINASKETNVSYTLKHFPGYSNNADTHKTSSISNKTLEEIQKQDLPPFIAGINEKAEAVMISHNIVSAIDSNNPASLSKNINDLLRNDLNFTGVIITDDISMNALDDIDNVEIKAILAGNDLLITSDYQKSFNTIKEGLQNNLITEEDIDDKVLKILEWKYYKHLL